MIDNLTLNMDNGYERENSKLTNIITGDLNNILDSKSQATPPIEIKENTESELILRRLDFSQVSEHEIQDNMSYLQKKEKDIESINDFSNKLKRLSDRYTNIHISNEEKSKIEKKATKLIENIDEIMNSKEPGKDDTMSEMLITIRSSRGQDTIFTSSSLYITLDNEISGDDSDKYFENKLSIKSILSTPSIIEEKILKPVEDALRDVHSGKSYLYDAFLDEYSLALAAIDDLYEIGGVSEGMKSILLTVQKNILSSISGIGFDHNNLLST